MPPALTISKGVGKTPKPPLSTPLARSLDTLPTFNLYKKPASPTPSPPQLHPPTSGASKGRCYLLSLPPETTGAPVKPCLNFLTGLLSISIDWGRPRTLVGIGFTVPQPCFSIASPPHPCSLAALKCYKLDTFMVREKYFQIIFSISVGLCFPF